MKQINKPVIGLDTKVEVELTIRELLNLAVATSNVAPCVVGKEMVDNWGFTKDESNNIIKSPTPPYEKQEDNVLYCLPHQIRLILKEYGYVRKDYEHEPVPNDY